MGAWGDEDEDEAEQLPGRHETAVDANGIKTVTEYRANAAGQKFKSTKQILVKTVETRVPIALGARKERLQRSKFGKAKGKGDDSNVTIVSNDSISIQNPKEDDQDDAAQHSTVKQSMNEFAKKQMWRKLQQKYGMEEGSSMPPMPEDEDSPMGGGGAGGAVKGAYVVPSMRGQAGAGVAGSALQRMAAYDDRDQATLRVTNISEDTAEADLQVLFAPYGPVARIYLAKDRETMISRGFAFVSYVSAVDAQNAMDALQGHGYDHLILKIEWAKPSTKDAAGAPGGGEGGLSSGFTSGYGTKLAQDTKEKVSYASNLTGNK
ncbi:hypothetical protein M885DRAFT_535198 [Pelagophyceae sp. CCMP2097]|nr:hypothetical protein M885DRAFT_535198 [Pelagophyceae sp. CCMP2097]|mmetsp:Transcript_6449/g.22821  ORF Transcript_6449/g.22821 Transcript_6449/m.22821 type:complete len:320 (+) Transcript_6449:38-997(+)